ncbi:MAG: hypothetical protein IH621_16630 [Krumholzibacteria bacterium]|nr:hypothetical protein [Candidatus Krumholzibacteria bacterium]
MNRSRRTGTLARTAVLLTAVAVACGSLHVLDRGEARRAGSERLYFPSGEFLVESSLGFREAMADWLWFRFIQYYGAFKNGDNDLRYLDLLIESITRLDPRFVQAYHLASLIYWSDFGRFEAAYDMLRKGMLANPDHAGLRFQMGFMRYVVDHDYPRAAHWFEMATRCSDATAREYRFAAFARYRAGDDAVSLALWKDLLQTSSSPQMQELAQKMIAKLERRIRVREEYGAGFIGPIPEI